MLQDYDWRALVLATGLATHAGGIQGRGCNQVGRDPTDVTTAGLLVKLRRERRQLCGKPTPLASARYRPSAALRASTKPPAGSAKALRVAHPRSAVRGLQQSVRHPRATAWRAHQPKCAIA